MIPIKKTIDTDVLVVGGGIGGLMAAVGACQEGAKNVLVAEKANTKRSGSGATGNDHFLCYMPEKHGADIGPILQETLDSLIGLCHDTKLTLRFLQETFKVAQYWQEWGIDMKPLGDWECMGHAYPGRPRIWLKYNGYNQKEVLTKAAKKHGAKILNHHPIVDLAYDDKGITGALALNVSEDEPSFTLIRAKSVILCTGTANRLYPPAGTPNYLFNTAFCPSCTGDAQGMAWRIGAKLVNLELPNRHAGPKFFARAGKSTWIGLYKYPNGKLLGPFVTKPTRELGDITSDVWNSSFTDLMMNGSGPAYLDCSETSREDLDFMRWAMEGEGLTSLLNYMDKAKIDPGKHAVEFMQYEPHLIGRGLEIDINGECSVPGLFAAGDMVGNFRADIAGAAVYGWIAGRHAAKRKATLRDDIADSPWIKERIAFYSSFAKRPESNPGWREANVALQQIMQDYAAAGPYRVRSETLLKAGLKYLGDLRTNAVKELKAPCSHTLMRAAETFDLMDCAEALMHAALERKETRGMHVRSDFTFTNPLLRDKFLTIRKEKGKIVPEWRDKWK